MISRVFTENTLNSPAYFLNQLTFVTSQTSSVYLVVACLLCYSWSSRSYCWLWSTTSIRSTRKNSSNDKIFKGLRSRSEWYWEIVEPEALDLGGGLKFHVNPVGHPERQIICDKILKWVLCISRTVHCHCLVIGQSPFCLLWKKGSDYIQLILFHECLCSKFISEKYKISMCGAL